MYMTYRLSTMFPCASGGVLWVEKAMNPTMGLVQGYLGENLLMHYQLINVLCTAD
jgi:amino acid transporter